MARAFESGLHYAQGDGGRDYLYGDLSVDTVADGIDHIGFATQGDRLLNEGGNANARVETVTYWLNELLGTTPLPPRARGRRRRWAAHRSLTSP